jgi:serine/threonine-protein phosphatase 2A regulatory subunit A
MIKRLSTGDWFTSRTSACGLYTPAYPLVSPAFKEELKKGFGLLCNDDTPMVRRAAATHLAKWIPVVDPTSTPDLVQLLCTLAQDEQDSVRLLTVDSVIQLSKKPIDFKQSLLPSLKSLCYDASWRVRYMIADKLVTIAQVVPEDMMELLKDVFLHLLKDSESEVRTAVCAQIPGFCAKLSSEVAVRDVLPVLKELTTDASQHVRAALASHVNGLAPMLGKQHTMDHLLPLFLQLLKDEASEVRLNVISKLDGVNQVIGIQLLSQSLLPAIVELAEDKQWRVRMAIIENVPVLGSQLGVSFFNEKMLSLCLGWLRDPVYQVREKATINIQKLTSVFGQQWCMDNVLPKLEELRKSNIFSHRLTCCFCYERLVDVFDTTGISRLLSGVLDLCTDKVANVKYSIVDLGLRVYES